jgi:hypothetical protein
MVSGRREEAVKRRRIHYLRWALALWTLSLGVVDAWRGAIWWGQRALLAELESRLSPSLLALFVVWSLVCAGGLVASAWGLMRGREWGRLWARVLVPLHLGLFQAYVWLFARSGLLWARRWVSLLGAIVAAGLVVGALTWRRSREWLGLGKDKMCIG